MLSLPCKCITLCLPADNDRQALQQTLQSTFARGKKQDMGLSGGADLTTYGLRAGKAPTAAAKKILEAAGSKFASAGAFEVAEQSAGGLSVRKEKLPTAPPKEVCYSPDLLQVSRHRQERSILAS